MIFLRDKTVDTSFARFFGLAFGIIGLCLAALAGFIIWDSMEAGLAALFVVVVSTSWFCTSTGWRLALNRPNRYGSIIRPWAWRTLAAIFLLLATSVVAFAWMDGSLSSPWPALGAAAFALLCFLCIWRAQMLGRPIKPDLPSNTTLEPTHKEKG